jgi:hypothetical protein
MAMRRRASYSRHWAHACRLPFGRPVPLPWFTPAYHRKTRSAYRLRHENT